MLLAYKLYSFSQKVRKMFTADKICAEVEHIHVFRSAYDFIPVAHNLSSPNLLTSSKIAKGGTWDCTYGLL